MPNLAKNRQNAKKLTMAANQQQITKLAESGLNWSVTGEMCH